VNEDEFTFKMTKWILVKTQPIQHEVHSQNLDKLPSTGEKHFVNTPNKSVQKENLPWTTVLYFFPAKYVSWCQEMLTMQL